MSTKPHGEVLDVVGAALLLGATEKAVRQPVARRFNGQLLDIETASALLGCSQKTLRARVARCTIPFRRLGERIVFLRTELETFLSELPGVTVDEARENLAARNAVTR